MQSAQPLQQRQGSSQAFSPQTRRDDRHAAQPLQQRQGSSQAFSPQTRGHDRHAVSQGSDHPGSSQAALGRTQPAVASSSGYSAGAGRSRPGAAPSAAHSRPQTGPQHGGAGAAPAGSAPLPGGLAGRKLTLRVLRAFDLRNTALGILPGDASDPFVVARLGGQEFKTQVVENSLNPVWNSQQFDFIVEDDDADPRLQLEIFSSNNWHANDSLGRLDVLVRNLTPGQAHTVLERVDEGEMPREDRKRGRLQVEVQLQLATQQQAVASRGQHRAHNPVPLPSFKGMGPEAFEAPKPSVEVAKVGEQRRLMEYESLACRLGQYDYTRAPSYYPKQEVTDKRQWKEDPFHGWRRELDRVEHNAPPPAMRGGGEHQEYWKKDPFHGWLQHDKGGQPEHLAGQGAGLERLQEAQAARQLQSLPSFRDAPARRFDDHREYASHEATPEPRERLSATRAAPQGGRRATGGEQRWKDDAFFGWLPGRGPASEEQHKLRRPLEQARLMRLPSFAEGAEALSGVTGRGVGVVSVWVNGAFDLAYSHGSGLRGKPSACVQLALKSTGGGSNGSTNQKPKLTETVALEANPRWNSPVMLFEVLSITDVLQLEVLDLANPRAEQHLHQYFLGRSSLPIQRILEPESSVHFFPCPFHRFIASAFNSLPVFEKYNWLQNLQSPKNETSHC
ncbi:unnamed protein product [Polarella glacialis]|uniref:C2 domain-containing protein n=1 Tax=Polarella glacialis TaxID=89957 RepID=A0A813GYS5_POLGL|nr:unnamed protein product [Polarella glacialis]